MNFSFKCLNQDSHFPTTIYSPGRHKHRYRVITGGSAFNIKAKSLRLGDFTRQEIETLIPRELTFSTQLTISEETAWYVKNDGLLDLDKLLAEFQNFFFDKSATKTWEEKIFTRQEIFQGKKIRVWGM